MESAAELYKKYQDPELKHKPEELMKRGGAYYSDSAAELMADIASDANTVHIVNAKHEGAVPGMMPDTVMEIPCTISKDGATPIATTKMRPDVHSLVTAVKDFELLTIQAAVHGDSDAAIRALVSNPLGPDLSVAPKLWQRLKEEHKGLLGVLDD